VWYSTDTNCRRVEGNEQTFVEGIDRLRRFVPKFPGDMPKTKDGEPNGRDHFKVITGPIHRLEITRTEHLREGAFPRQSNNCVTVLRFSDNNAA